jgi:hypothetical protein
VSATSSSPTALLDAVTAAEVPARPLSVPESISLLQALAALAWVQAPGSRRRQVAHGRAESRSVKIIDLDGGPGAALFPYAARAVKVVRRRREQRTGRTSTKIVYAVTSLTYPPSRSRAAGRLDPGPLGNREPGAPRPRRHPG